MSLRQLLLTVPVVLLLLACSVLPFGTRSESVNIPPTRTPFPTFTPTTVVQPTLVIPPTPTFTPAPLPTDTPVPAAPPPDTPAPQPLPTDTPLPLPTEPPPPPAAAPPPTQPPPPPQPVAPAAQNGVVGKITFRDGRNTYAVGEKVFVKIEATNVESGLKSFGVLGLVPDTGNFQTSWDNGSIDAGATFNHEDGLAFAAPGNHKLWLSICFSTKEECQGPNGNWVRYEPGLDVIVQ